MKTPIITLATCLTLAACGDTFSIEEETTTVQASLGFESTGDGCSKTTVFDVGLVQHKSVKGRFVILRDQTAMG